MAVHIPTELIVQILYWLPSKSLIRCRSVCKSWLSLISSTQFRLLYLHHFSRHLVLRLSSTENKGMLIVPDDQDTRVLPIEFPSNLYLDLRTIGCCNGVICLASYYENPEKDEIVLWNPSIRRKLTLIHPASGNNDSNNRVLGFEYDKITDDYKVVRLAYDIRSILSHPHVEVYTVKTAIWRVVRLRHSFPCFCIMPHFTHAQVCFNGSAHWIAGSNTHIRILTFDINTECFGEIQLPESLAKENPMGLGLVVVKESLGVVYFNCVTNTSSTYVIWAMKEYKNPASWTMLYNMHYPDKDVGRSVLGLTNDGDLITMSLEGSLEIHNKEGCYNMYGNYSNEGFVSESIFVERYQESLALLDVGDEIGNEGQVHELVDE